MRKFFVMYFSLSSYLVYRTSLKMYKVEGSTTQEQSFCIISESFLGSRFFTMHALLLKKYYVVCTGPLFIMYTTYSNVGRYIHLADSSVQRKYLLSTIGAQMCTGGPTYMRIPFTQIHFTQALKIPHKLRNYQQVSILIPKST